MDSKSGPNSQATTNQLLSFGQVMKSIGFIYFICKNWVIGENWTRTRVLSSYTYKPGMVMLARWGLRSTEVSQLKGSHLLLSIHQWCQAELKVIQTAMGNISISLNMVRSTLCWPTKHFCKIPTSSFWTPESSVPVWYDPQSCPAIGMCIKHSEENMDPEKDGH